MKPSTNNDDNENQDARDARHEESSASDIKEKGGYIAQLEARLSSVSNQLEEKHMEAAIDAELECIKEISDNDGGASARKEPSNPNSVSNCLSPFVPTSSERIQAFVDWAGLTSDDVLLDIGCGDGRVCIAAAKLCGCRTIGIDVSPLCINQANSIVREEGMVSLCSFYKTDATVDPELLLSGNDQGKLKNNIITICFTYEQKITN